MNIFGHQVTDIEFGAGLITATAISAYLIGEGFILARRHFWRATQRLTQAVGMARGNPWY